MAQSNKFDITVDGNDYNVIVEHDGDVITVKTLDGTRIADAERDHQDESVVVNYFDDDGIIEEKTNVLTDLFDKSAMEIATYAAATYY